MNSKQGIFVSGLGLGGILLLTWILGVANKISFAESFLGVLISLGMTGVLMICMIGAAVIYEGLANGN